MPQLKTIETLDPSPFKKMVMTIGTLPSAFVESMTYYEALCWFTNYLQKEVIPAVNNNAEAVEELQQAWIELKEFCDNYFTELNVQEEINNKLDAMAEDGTLADIINQEIFTDLSNQVTTNTEDISTIKPQINTLNAHMTLDESEDTILIGDSYLGAPAYHEASVDTWGDILMQLLGLTENTNCWVRGASGAGFYRKGVDNQTFLTLLQGLSGTITNKNKVKRIIVCGGVNDTNADNQGVVQTALSNFMTYAKSTYPNATVYVGMISWNAGNTNASLREEILTEVLPAYQNVRNFGGVYLNGVEYILHYYGFLDSAQTVLDAGHPNAEGQRWLGRGIYQALKGGTTMLTVSEGTATMVGSTFKANIRDNILTVRFQGNASLGLSEDATSGNKSIDLGELPNSFMRSVGDKNYFTMNMMLRYSDNSWVVQPVRLNTDNNHHLLLNFYSTKNLAITGASWVIENLELPLLYW